MENYSEIRETFTEVCNLMRQLRWRSEANQKGRRDKGVEKWEQNLSEALTKLPLQRIEDCLSKLEALAADKDKEQFKKVLWDLLVVNSNFPVEANALLSQYARKDEDGDYFIDYKLFPETSSKAWWDSLDIAITFLAKLRDSLFSVCRVHKIKGVQKEYVELISEDSYGTACETLPSFFFPDDEEEVNVSLTNTELAYIFLHLFRKQENGLVQMEGVEEISQLARFVEAVSSEKRKWKSMRTAFTNILKKSDEENDGRTLRGRFTKELNAIRKKLRSERSWPELL